MDKNDFIAKVYDKQNVLLLIELNKECVVGGYTKTGWNIPTMTNDEWTHYVADIDAFLFHFKSSEQFEPFISNVRDDSESICKALAHDLLFGSSYAGFGCNWMLYIDCGMIEQSGAYGNENYESFRYGARYLTGKNRYKNAFLVIEVFQIQIE